MGAQTCKQNNNKPSIKDNPYYYNKQDKSKVSSVTWQLTEDKINKYQQYGYIPNGNINLKEFKANNQPVEIHEQYGRIKKIVYLEQEGINDISDFLQKRMDFKHPSLISLDSYRFRQMEQGPIDCNLTQKDKKKKKDQNKYGIVQADYRYALEMYFQDAGNFTLEDRIIELCRNKTSIKEAELRHIFERVVNCLNYLDQMGTCHGDIKVSSIYMRKVNSQVYMDNQGYSH